MIAGEAPKPENAAMQRGSKARKAIEAVATRKTGGATPKHQLTHSSLELIERHAKVTRRGLSRVMSKIACRVQPRTANRGLASRERLTSVPYGPGRICDATSSTVCLKSSIWTCVTPPRGAAQSWRLTLGGGHGHRLIGESSQSPRAAALRCGAAPTPGRRAGAAQPPRPEQALS